VPQRTYALQTLWSFKRLITTFEAHLRKFGL
jgi:hypothetical protein